jgi:hypothetical protein
LSLLLLIQGALEDLDLCIPLLPPKYQWDIKKEAEDLREEITAAAEKAARDAAAAQEASTAVLGRGGHVVLQEIGPDHEEEVEVGLGGVEVSGCCVWLGFKQCAWY